MPETIFASANPEKRLFVHLITRDISLGDAILDLIDNSINAALQPLADNLKTADDYERFLADKQRKPTTDIELTVSSARILVYDSAPGISAKAAENDVFRFGRAEGGHENDRLSVYGIGLKRAMFKCGNRIDMVSDHRDGGFELKLNVRTWEGKPQERWGFDITTRSPATGAVGTRILITELYDDMVRRIGDGLFLTELRDQISRTYSFFIGRIVNIKLNGEQVKAESFEIGSNFAVEKFTKGTVSCNIKAGIAATTGDTFRDRNSGWFVFCNGRTVLFADKSNVTGWGAGLAIFQPKHRPFLGTVFFVSPDPEALPWTTTKGSINEESNVWQEAKREMVKVGHVITGFLDRRYSEDGAGIAPSELASASGKGVSVLTAAASTQTREFRFPKTVRPRTIRIQYEAKVVDMQTIEAYLRRPGMGGSEVGRYTFNWFLKNVVGEDK
jgi:hypothetical protein